VPAWQLQETGSKTNPPPQLPAFNLHEHPHPGKAACEKFAPQPVGQAPGIQLQVVGSKIVLPVQLAALRLHEHWQPRGAGGALRVGRESGHVLEQGIGVHPQPKEKLA